MITLSTGVAVLLGVGLLGLIYLMARYADPISLTMFLLALMGLGD